VARPYVDAFGADAIQLVHFADLVEPTGPGWRELTDFLALAPRPGEQRRTREPDAYALWASSRFARQLWQLRSARQGRMLPAPIRRAGRKLTMRRDGTAVDAIRRVVFGTPLPVEVRQRLDAQWRAVHALFGIPAPERGEPTAE